LSVQGIVMKRSSLDSISDLLEESLKMSLVLADMLAAARTPFQDLSVYSCPKQVSDSKGDLHSTYLVFNRPNRVNDSKSGPANTRRPRANHSNQMNNSQLGRSSLKFQMSGWVVMGLMSVLKQRT
jgi:hypothetical protein